VTIRQRERVPGVLLIEPRVSSDDRGWFAELFQAQELREHGYAGDFVRSALSFNQRAGTLRGLHFQRAPHQDAKLVTCVGGALFDVVVDVRPESPAFGRWEAFELSAENRRALFIPAGVAHGFQTLDDATTMLYHIGAYYHRDAGGGVRWDDPTLGIRWPAPPTTMSAQDTQWASLTR
jgi:dTDP-4-dehydrorhamnose 3,5-epimerase